MSNAAVLPQDLHALAEQLVHAGEYASVNDVAHEAFRLLQQGDKRRDQVREDLASVFGEMDGGNYLEPSDDEFAQLVRDRALNHSVE